MPTARVDETKCTNCGVCIRLCPDGIYVPGEGAAAVDETALALCVACGQCMAACPAEAIHVEGLDPAGFHPLPAAEQVASAEALRNLMLQRRSIRAYTEKPVAREALQRLVDAAALAPMGFPPSEVRVTVLANRAQVAEVAPACAGQMRMLRRMSGTALGRLVMRRMVGAKTWRMLRKFLVPMIPRMLRAHEEGRDFVAYGAPAMLVFHVAGDSCAGETDVTLAATYAMLMAEALGLGSVMLGLGAAAYMDKGLKARHGIPADHEVLSTLAVGYAAERYLRSIPRELASVEWR